MTGLDTNVLVRYLTQDDAVQSARATRLIERALSVRNRGLVSVVVLCELMWVLTSANAVHERDLVSIVERLLGAKELQFEAPQLVRQALAIKTPSSAGLADILIGLSHRAQGAAETVSFDKRAARLLLQGRDRVRGLTVKQCCIPARSPRHGFQRLD